MALLALSFDEGRVDVYCAQPGARRRSKTCLCWSAVCRAQPKTHRSPPCRIQSFSRPFQSRGLRSGGTPRIVRKDGEEGLEGVEGQQRAGRTVCL